MSQLSELKMWHWASSVSYRPHHRHWATENQWSWYAPSSDNKSHRTDAHVLNRPSQPRPPTVTPFIFSNHTSYIRGIRATASAVPGGRRVSARRLLAVTPPLAQWLSTTSWFVTSENVAKSWKISPGQRLVHVCLANNNSITSVWLSFSADMVYLESLSYHYND